MPTEWAVNGVTVGCQGIQHLWVGGPIRRCGREISNLKSSRQDFARNPLQCSGFFIIIFKLVKFSRR